MQNSFLINRTDFMQCKFINNEIPQVAEGEVLFCIEKASFTSNNITYAMVGDKIGYWQFFPAEQGWGIIPTWGFAEVISSKHLQVSKGERFYGYFPMSSHLLVKVGKVSHLGFLDTSNHRSNLPIIYNYYHNTQADQLYSKDTEEITSIFRPLFLTSFLLDDFFADNQFFGADNIILTGASSKTALGLAFLLYLRQQNSNKSPKIIGLTSAHNVDFVKNLNTYNTVLTYEQVAELYQKDTYSIVDFAGNQMLQSILQKHLGNQLKYNCAVGMTHWDKNYMPEYKTNNKPILFFAPTHAQKRNQDWGGEGFQSRLREAWDLFKKDVRKWVIIKYINTEDGIKEMYLEMLEGKIEPEKGNIISF